MSGGSLAELQGWLFERILEPAAAFASAPAVEERVVAGSLSARERVGIYRHGYVARLVECLEDDYPALQHALGSEPFAELCRDFIRQHPPRSPSLNYYGAPFAGYCAGRRERWARFSAELAQLEWALVESIHEHEGERLELASLVPLSPEDWARARLLPSPTLRLLQTHYPVGSYYQAWREGEALTERFPAPERSALAVCRRGADVWRVQVELQLVPLIVSLIDGTPLLAALEAAATPSENSAAAPSSAVLQHAFRDWVSCGMFSGVDTAQP
ncbi:MAG: hypothetical protein RL033_3190 [Pseudomonadota bacterium]|jgi:hypothetical protein